MDLVSYLLFVSQAILSADKRGPEFIKVKQRDV
jgi:hypothetical protein